MVAWSLNKSRFGKAGAVYIGEQGTRMLVDTKLSLPSASSEGIIREDLLDRLSKVAGGRLAIVSAPAGFGKTTLLAQWASKQRLQNAAVGWLSVEASDNDIGRFLGYFLAAIRSADPASGDDMPRLIGSSPILPMDVILTKLVNALNARAQDLFLVLDDIHHLDAPEIAEFLQALLGHAPQSLHLIFGTRSQVPVQLAGLRARGQLVRIDEGELRFTLAESQIYLNQSLVMNLSEADVVTLHHRTEGWIAGLHLASLSMANRDERARFMDRFTGAEGDIAEFLIQEVLDRQPPEILDFLLCTAILDRFSAPLADAITASRDSQTLICRVASANLFLIPLDQERTWFRYHALFADLLRGLLGRTDPARMRQLHLRAAQWLAGAGMTAEAVHHALAAEDINFAATLVEICCMPLIRQRNIAQVREWLGRLPDYIIAERPRLQLAQVWSHFHTSQPREGVRILRKVRDALSLREARGSQTLDEGRELRAELQVLTAGLASAADRSGMAVRLAERALRDVPKQMYFLRGVVGNVLGFSHYSLGNLQAARVACLQARACHADGQHAFGIVYSDLILGLTDKAAGDLPSALDHFARATSLARESDGPGSYSEAMVGIFEAEIQYERNDLAAAARLVAQHRPIIEECGLVVHTMSCKLLGARLAAASGEVETALTILEAAERQGLRTRYRRLFSTALHERIKLMLARGETQYARLILSGRKIDEVWLASPQSQRPACEFEHLALARVLIAENRPEAALRLLDPLAERLRRDGRNRRLALVRAVAAVAALRSGNVLGLVAAASDAVNLCLPGGAVRTLLDEGAAFRDVLSFAQDRISLWRRADTGTGQFVASLLGAPATQGNPATRPASRHHFAFSTRETEVIRLLCAGMSNRDMGAALSMSPDTVKWHLKNVFGKLGVSSRTHAVLRLQEIGLFAATQTGG